VSPSQRAPGARTESPPLPRIRFEAVGRLISTFLMHSSMVRLVQNLLTSILKRKVCFLTHYRYRQIPDMPSNAHRAVSLTSSSCTYLADQADTYCMDSYVRGQGFIPLWISPFPKLW
jgi:hypothetical protein